MTTRDGVRPFHAMEILKLAQALEADGREICHLEIGEPGAPPAPAVIAAAKRALERPQRYTAAKGMAGLRRALAARYGARHGVEVDPERIFVTMGSSSGFILAFLSAFEAGTRIAVTRPGYPATLNILAALHLQPVDIPVRLERGWRLTAADIEVAHAQEPFEGLLFASPANPTGATVDAEEMAAIARCCARLGITLVSDEIYHGLGYGGREVSALEASGEAIVVNSFSKYFCMTGWRIGWLVMPEALVRRAEMMAQSLFISASSLAQTAALAALGEGAYYDAQRDRYARNREMLAEGLARLGFKGTATAQGAFYAYVDASPFTNDTMAFCKGLLEHAGVAATPGVDFDRVDGAGFVRFCYAGTPEVIEEAVERMAGYLK